MTIEIEIQGVTGTDMETAWLQPQNLSVSAEIGGASFPRSIVVSDADWNFLTLALQAPPTLNPAIQRLLTAPSVLEG